MKRRFCIALVLFLLACTEKPVQKTDAIQPDLISAVEEHVKGKSNNAELRGIAILFSNKNIYLLGADITLNQKVMTVHFMGSVFTDKENKTYWKIDELDEENQKVLRLLQNGG